jgi:phage replication O-like protein O
MADPQIENGHTRIANELLEHLIQLHLSPNQWQVLLCIIRKTYGFHKKVDRIANSQVVEATGLGKSVVCRAIKNLQDRKLITRNGKHIGIQKDWERWAKLAEQSTLGTKLAEQLTTEKLAEQSTEVSRTANQSYQNCQQKLAVLLPTKDKRNSTKDTLQKKAPRTELPDWIDGETWGDYIEMRKTQKKPPTPGAIKLIISKLQKLRDAGDDPNEVLRQSIISGWTGVFPLKERNGKAKHSRDLPKTYTPTADYPDL